MKEQRTNEEPTEPCAECGSQMPEQTGEPICMKCITEGQTYTLQPATLDATPNEEE